MKKSITPGLQIKNAKGEVGTITKIITPSTGYAEVAFNGIPKKVMLKVMSYTTVDGAELFAKKEAVAKAPKILSAEEILKNTINCTTRFLAAQIADGKKSFIYDVKEVATEQKNDMVISICNYALTRENLTDKQSYVIALFAANNNIEFNVNAN